MTEQQTTAKAPSENIRAPEGYTWVNVNTGRASPVIDTDILASFGDILEQRTVTEGLTWEVVQPSRWKR